MQPDKTKAFTARLPAAEYEALRAFAFLTDSTLADVLAQCVRAFLADHGRDERVDALLEQTRAKFRETIDRLGSD